jgi:hypothetical protein
MKKQANIDGGYVLLARKSQHCDELINGPPIRSKLWHWLLIKANYRDGDKLRRGQLFTTIAEMREAMAYRIGYRKIIPSIDQIRSAYEALAKATMITTTKTTRGLIVTICNYSFYQNPKNYEAHTEAHTEDVPKPTPGPTLYQKKERTKKKEKPVSDEPDLKPIDFEDIYRND